MTDFPKRTGQQNKSLHKWAELIAESWNDSGYEMKLTFSSKLDAPWTKESVKLVIKKISKAMYNKPHTSDLTTQELTKVGDVLNRYLAEQGISVPFPSIEEVIRMQDAEEERKKNYKQFKDNLSNEERKQYNKAFGEE
jgi:hypothetical protein